MIKIEITGENFEAIQQQMMNMVTIASSEPVVQADPEPVAVVEETPPVKIKRKRRTKAQIEAEKAATSENHTDSHTPDTPENTHLIKQDDPRLIVRGILSQIEMKHGAKGLAQAVTAINAVCAKQEGDYEKTRVSNVTDENLPDLTERLIAVRDA